MRKPATLSYSDKIKRYFPTQRQGALWLLALGLSVNAADFRLHVTDKDTGEGVEFVAVAIDKGSTNYGGLTDEAGNFSRDIPAGTYTLNINFVGYHPVKRTIKIGDAPDSLAVALTPAYNQLDEVVVTAKEGRGMASASVIDREAMQHLQPSSFTDLMELLPGSTSKDPAMGKANLANLRQATNIQTDGYDTSSLGTSFVIDGVPINTNADMQTTADATRAGRLTAGKGVDMRALSTDDIESVEVVRGIASAEYGETTSGLINIKRKTGETPLHFRFKADMQSQLFYVGKGFRMPGNDWSLNTSVDWLDSRIDPRNNRDNFKRLTASIRSSKKWNSAALQTTWNTSLNYTGTFERDKNDPDLTVNNTIDYYTNDRHNLSWDNTLTLTSNRNRFFQSFVLTAGLSYADEHLYQQKTIASSRVYPMPVSTKPGSNYVGYLPMLYLSELDVFGKPLTAVTKGAARFRYRIGTSSNTLKAGAEWNMSKNLGRGQVYDIMRPITAGNNTRPRPFSDIPAMHQLSAYVENVSDIHLGQWAIEAQLGLRETQLIHLDRKYYLANRPHLDPRGNLKLTFPSTFVDGYPIGWEIGGGAGLQTKMPVSAFLFPDLRYTDYVQLNYFHNNEEYRTMNVMTFVEDITNYDLKAARNFKWEVRGDVTYRNNRLSVTYFREDMKNAFRQAPVVHFYEFKRYDASGFDPDAAGGAPTIDQLPSTTDQRIALISQASNSSRMLKEGVEFTFSSKRIPVVRTRVTVNGAWFRTTLSNSEDLWYKPGSVVDGKELQYAGLYNDREGNVYQSFNTNFTFDTDVPRLGLNFSISVQNTWFTLNRQLWKSGIPQYYVGPDGQILPFLDAMADDPYLGQLIRNYTESAFNERRVPIATTFNIKATKKLWNDRLGIAIYVNRLASITPDYYLYGSLQRRYTSPYFGMELNLKL